jgi:membrane-associated protein
LSLIHQAIHFITHLDVYLASFIQAYGVWAYGLLFLIIFCETGLVVTPFLPGDTLLFAAGAMAANHLISISVLLPVLAIAAITGDQVNRLIGSKIGHLLVHKKDCWYFKQSYLQRTHDFYEKFGGKTLVIARFVPILRTFAPFVAGLGEMRYSRFCLFSIIGGIFWTALVSLAGFLFSNIPVVKNNFTYVIFAIIILSILPAVFELYRNKFAKN